jgi:hypothetical protein
LFAAAQAKETASEASIFVEAGTATFPAATVPIAAWGPSGTGLGTPPAALGPALGPALRPAITVTPIIAVADNENGSAAAFDPKTLAVNAPSYTLNAATTANLAVQADLIGIEVAAVLAVFVPGFAGYGSLSRSKGRDNKTSKRYTEEANKGRRFHGLALSCAILNPTKPHVRWETRKWCGM